MVKATVSLSVQIQRITTCADYFAYQANMAISTMRTVDPRITSVQGAKNRIVGWLQDALPTIGATRPRKDSRLTQAQGDFLIALLLGQVEDLDHGSDQLISISTRDRFSLLLMLLCGLRIGELLNLKVIDIDFGSITSLHVRRRPVDPDERCVSGRCRLGKRKSSRASPFLVIQSKGNCWGNPVMERFFLNLKMERVWQQDYANHLEAVQDVTDYIVNFYNAHRLHSTLGYRSPNQYELCRN